jgi:hypothetical protein
LKLLRKVWAAAAFAGAVLAINRHWFRAPIVELSDFAANSLQVYHARLFREMLGNYSRWQFHHPGPFFFYLFAAGERVFHDWLRVAPGTYNAQLITLVLANTAFLFGAIEIFAGYFTGRLFRPLALAGAVVWMSTINRTIPTGAMVSAWMPHVALLAFVFFLAAAASVAAGRARHLPLMALGAMILVHLHVAQLLIAGTLSAAACAALAIGEWRAGRGGALWREHGKAIAGSAAIVAVFLLPIIVELAVDRPNNLDDIRAYLTRYPHPSLGLGTAGRYFLSFLVFLPDSTVLMGGGPSLAARLVSTPYVLGYWAIYAASLCGAAMAARHTRPAAARMAWIVAGECVLTGGLFLVWANRITGDLYNFNGFFIYSIQLLGLWAIAGVLAEWKASEGWARAAWVVPFAAMVAMAAEFRNPDRGSTTIPRMVEELGAAPVHLVFEHDDWDTAAGIANQLARRGQPFCVDASWFYLFGRQYVCREGSNFARRVVTAGAVYEPGRRPMRLPAAIGVEDAGCLREGFYACDADHCWTGRRAALGFTLLDGAAEYRVTITGSVLPERPVEVGLNGRRLGRLEGIWKSAASFPAPGEWMRPGERNLLTFECPRAGPVSGDARELGFSLMTVEIAAAVGGTDKPAGR